MRRIVFAIAVLLSWPALAEPDDGVLAVSGVIDTASDEGGAIEFELAGVPQHFIMDQASVSDSAAIVDMIASAMQSGHRIEVRFQADSAGIDPDGGKPTYVVSELVYEGRTVAGENGEAITRIAELSTPAELQLARGVALRYEGNHDDDARVQIDAAIADPLLGPLPRAIGLMVRADMASQRALFDMPPGAERDRLLIAALADFSAWSELRPNNRSAASRVGDTLAELGAYDEALNTYEAALQKWPNDTLWTAIMIAMVHRARGDNDKALAVLDSLVARTGPQDGMAYHYHRGWTLTALGRYDDAIAEFTAGLRTQPDYPGAYLRRACALAKTGRLAEALADEDKAVEVLRAQRAEVAPMADAVFNLQQASIGAAAIRRAMDRDEHEKADAPCESFWDDGLLKPRERSALLPQRSALTGGAAQTPAPMQ